MKRVGLLTFHHVHNFGAVWQAWSVVSAVRALGHDITAINYQPVIGHDAPRRGWRKFIPSLGKLRMQSFVRRHIPVSGTPLHIPEAVDAHVDSASYDVLVCGSDQVWMIFDHQGIDRPYFLGVGNAPGLRRISYAPSAGSRRSFGEFTPEAAELLGQFQNISVRDANTAAALDEAGITGAVRVVDPTLIADFTPMLKGSPNRRDIVVVGRMDAAAERYIRFAAQKLGCKVRAIGTRCGAADVQRPFASPVEWLNEIANARLVVTSLFHGAAISMALRTPFVALDCGGRAFKLADLCGFLDVPERLLLRGEAADYAQEETLLSMEYDTLDTRLRAESERCRRFLGDAING